MTTPESFRETWRNIATTFFKLGITSYSGPAIWTQDALLLLPLLLRQHHACSSDSGGDPDR